MMRDNYYTTPRPGSNMDRCRSRLFRQGPKENWPYRRVLRRRLSDSFTSQKFHPKCHECDCYPRWNYDSDYYPRHSEPCYRDNDYMNINRTGLTPAYQMLRIDSDHVAFFVEKSTLEAVLSSASGFIDKSKIPVRIELEDPVNGPFYNKKLNEQRSEVDHKKGYDAQQRNPYASHESKESEMDGAESDDSDTTVYFHEVYSKGKAQVPERPSSRNDKREEKSRTWGYYGERDLSVPLRGESHADNRNNLAKMNNSTKQTSMNSTAGYFTKEYKEYLQRNVVNKYSPESATADFASAKQYNEAYELPNYDIPQVRNPPESDDSIKRWFNENHDQPVSSNSLLQNTS